MLLLTTICHKVAIHILTGCQTIKNNLRAWQLSTTCNALHRSEHILVHPTSLPQTRCLKTGPADESFLNLEWTSEKVSIWGIEPNTVCSYNGHTPTVTTPQLRFLTTEKVAKGTRPREDNQLSHLAALACSGQQQ